jgi:hypothetical protein
MAMSRRAKKKSGLDKTVWSPFAQAFQIHPNADFGMLLDWNLAAFAAGKTPRSDHCANKCS